MDNPILLIMAVTAAFVVCYAGKRVLDELFDKRLKARESAIIRQRRLKEVEAAYAQDQEVLAALARAEREVSEADTTAQAWADHGQQLELEMRGLRVELAQAQQALRRQPPTHRIVEILWGEGRPVPTGMIAALANLDPHDTRMACQALQGLGLVEPVDVDMSERRVVSWQLRNHRTERPVIEIDTTRRNGDRPRALASAGW